MSTVAAWTELTTDERQRLRDLEKEGRELLRANTILKVASISLATELACRDRGTACVTPSLLIRCSDCLLYQAHGINELF